MKLTPYHAKYIAHELTRRCASDKAIQAPSLGTLRPCREESVNFDTTENLIIEGDNLEVLKLLQKSYLGKVKMIYIDPPYNTGNDFIYPDNYTESLQTYLEYTGQVDAEGRKFGTNTEADGRFHSKWLNMMYPRLYLARNLLCEDGVIFISIDDNEVGNLRRLCDELFGEEAFLCQICVVSNPRGRQSEAVATTHEYILAAARSAEDCQLEGQPLDDTQLAEYKHETPDGRKYRIRGLRHRGNASRRVEPPKMYFPIFVENQAARQIPMRMADWVAKLDAFLQFNEYEVLTNAGSVSAEVAKRLAEERFATFRVQQDRRFESDFEKEVKRIEQREGKGNAP